MAITNPPSPDLKSISADLKAKQREVRVAREALINAQRQERDLIIEIERRKKAGER